MKKKTCAARMILESNNLTDLIRGQNFSHVPEDDERYRMERAFEIYTSPEYPVSEESFICKYCECFIPVKAWIP